MNKIQIVGRMVADAKLVESSSGNKMTRISIACASKRKNADGSKKTDFFNCIAFNKTAEVISQYFTKGKVVCVSGYMDSSKRDDKTYWDVIIEDCESFSVKSESKDSDKPFEEVDAEEEDLPF